ncbi:Hypothetical protein FKW44_014613 [Caligus rogercresseyi]|uniref:Uncharacterized protein n=1 Tax=Caligus rogercresseyi TaxID=217165 RepID=A0A7T8GZ47_CALRO|nr:Hypothetical protein FKW44_014613 [Caligus rogercresseyi]
MCDEDQPHILLSADRQVLSKGISKTSIKHPHPLNRVISTIGSKQEESQREIDVSLNDNLNRLPDDSLTKMCTTSP